jgi:putative inorganic carbon (hco3(-)) transporter
VQDQMALSRVARNLTIPTFENRGVLQWTAIAVVGVLLGAFAIGVTLLPTQWAMLVAMAALGLCVATILGSIKRLLLAVIVFNVPFRIDTHIGYRVDEAAMGAIGGLNLSLTTIALVVLYVLWLVESLAPKGRPSRVALGISLPFGLYLAFVALSALNARDTTLAAFEIAMLIQMLLLLVYVASTVRTRDDVQFIVLLMVVGLFFQSLLIIGLRFTGIEFNFAGLSSRVDVDGQGGSSVRVGGTIGSPNYAASYLATLLVPTAAILLTNLRPWHKWLAAATLLVGGIALVLTFSRGGWLALAVSMVILVSFVCLRGWLSPALPFALIAPVAVLALVFQDSIASRLLSDDGGAAYSRVPLMSLAFRMIADNPILGVGANNFAVAMREYASPEFGREWLYTVHNKYLLVLAESGIGAFVAFIAFLLVTLLRGVQGWRSSDRLLALVAIGLAAGLAGQMVHMSFDIFNHRPQIQLLCLIAGLIAAISHMANQRDWSESAPEGSRSPRASLRIKLESAHPISTAGTATTNGRRGDVPGVTT